jgi:mannose-6-phosphate isomerase-like protein (cupin superfamily)
MKQRNPRSIVVGKDEGESFWQPKKAGGYITMKVSPWNLINATHTVFLQELPPGGMVTQHYHEHMNEIFIGLSGQGIIIVDGKEFEFGPEVVAYVGRETMHSIQATGDQPLKFVVISSPTGLEERLKQMGKPRKPGEPTPEPFESSAPPESYGVKRSQATK